MKLNYLGYEKAKEVGYIDNIDEYHVVIKAGFVDFKDMKNTIESDSLAVNKGDGFLYTDDLRHCHLYVYDGLYTIFEAGIISDRLMYNNPNIYRGEYI